MCNGRTLECTYTQVTIRGLRVAAAVFNPIPTLELECSYRHTFIVLC